MKAHIKSQIEILAPIEKVWQILADFKAYPDWSPTIKNFEGNPQVGRRSKVQLSQPGGMSIKMNPKFLSIEPNQELRWKGRLLFDGIFDGEHYFMLTAIDQNKTLLKQGEFFSGILVGFLKRMIEGNTQLGFDLFNQAIKSRAEGKL